MRRALAQFLLACLVTTAATAAEVVLNKETVYVSKNKIYLADIAASYTGVDAKTKEKLQAIYLKMAAVPGHGTVITKEQVQNRVSKYFKTIMVTGPEKVVIRTSQETVKWEDVQDTAVKYMKARMPWMEEDTEITVQGPKEDIQVLSGDVLLKVREDNKAGVKGNVVVPVQIVIDGKDYKIQPVSMTIKVVTGCLIAMADIERREIAPVSKVETVRKDITYLPDDVIINAAELSRMAAKRAIMQGTVLTRSMFEVLPAFRRGETASVVVRAGLVTVEAVGTALEDGVEGQKAKVQMESGKTVEGTVKDGKVLISR